MNKRKFIISIFLVFFAAFFVIFAACVNPDNFAGEEVDFVPFLGDPLFVETAIETSPESPPNIDNQNQQQNYQPNYQDHFGDDIPISRALVAKMLALAFSNRLDIDMADRIINFGDTRPGLWYDRYINMTVSLGLMGNGIGDNFYPENPLTLEEAQTILDILHPNNLLRIAITEENRNMSISYALWVDLFLKTLENLDSFGDLGLEVQNIILLATSETNPQLPLGNAIAASGHFTVFGYNLAAHIDREITVMHKDREIIALLELVNDTPVIRNAFVVGSSPDSITVFTGGIERTYLHTSLSPPAGSIADIRINSKTGFADEITIFEQSISGVVREVNNYMVEIAEYGRIPTHEDFRVYSVVDGIVSWQSPSALIVGSNIAEFIIRDGTAAAAVILRRPMPDYIRIVISTTGFAGYIHNVVELSSADGFVLYAGELRMEFAPNERLILSALNNPNLFDNDRIFAQALQGGKMRIHSISRNWQDNQAPEYRGILEISQTNHSNGTPGFILINQLPMEEYLYAVIPSEMPTSHGLEAAKVQAITARSYAYNQFHANRFHELGANVDDSIQSQVYNNIPETLTSVAAVDATAGMYLTYEGAVISANFFSTSAGVTANLSDVWLDTQNGEFADTSPVYLSSRPQYLSGDFGDLSREENARRFFTDTTIESFDDAFPWFRWNFMLSFEEMAMIINSNLASIYADNYHLVKTMDENGNFRSMPFSENGIGDFLGMEVVSRGQGGNIRELKIFGSHAVILVRTEYTIRRLLAPVAVGGDMQNIVMNRHNAAPVNNMFMLPSTFMVFETVGGYVMFYGGGFGHGVGMSQNGVRGMIDRGFGFEQILAHYYPGTRIMTLN
ncbi:MAG: SpoIID/LytB domain-containing protein [Defluviitaleaceae bacterium]|nr:SpoIID/LytB domain-containing protein [Defluviitaleaceae bacterium]